MTNKTIIFGHRGFPDKFVENSIEGFNYCLNHGFEGIEFDVHLTKDNVPIIMHDEKIDRTTDGKGCIKDFTLQELNEFHLSNGEKIPTLRNLLQIAKNKDVILNLEFKTDIYNYKNIEKIVFDTLKECEPKNIVFSSFNLETLVNCYALDKSQKYFFLSEKKINDYQSMLAKNHLLGFHLNQYQAEIKAPQRIWTVNDEAWMIELYKNKVEGIFTDNYLFAKEVRDKL